MELAVKLRLASRELRLSAAAIRELKNHGVRVLTGQPVGEVRKNNIVMKDGTELPSEMTIWAAGIKALGFLSELDGLEVNSGNQLVVEQTLQTTQDNDIFAFGDCAACPQADTERPVPPGSARSMLRNSFSVVASRRT